MTRPRPLLRPRLTASAVSALFLAAAFGLHAHSVPSPATPEACAPLPVDADRLACYDAALGGKAGDTRSADIAAKEAKAIQRNLEIGDEIAGQPPETGKDRKSASDVFEHDDPLNRAIANAGRGGLLDSRWE